MNRFNMPRIKVNSVEEYQLFESKLDEFQNFINNYNDVGSYKTISGEFMNWNLPNFNKSSTCIQGFIDELDDLTNNINQEWCEYRILTSVEMFIKNEGDIHGKDVDLVNIILGLNNNNNEEQLPKIYCELSDKVTEWSLSDDHVNILNIPYYECGKCGKLDDYGVAASEHCMNCQPSSQ